MTEIVTSGTLRRFRAFSLESARGEWAYLLLLMTLAAGIRLIDVWRPVDGTVWEPWREPDVAGIARNFYREGMNLFYPRIDWRGDGPGYVEAEFPLYPWVVAGLYHLVGYHEELLRVVSLFIGLTTCIVFYRLARQVLPVPAALVSLAMFICSPLAVRLSTAIQPEPLMLLCYVFAADQFLRWIQHEQRTHFVLALAATMLAILVKLPAAHIGLLFAFLCLQKWGWRAVLRTDLWIFIVLALGVPALWYWHAHQLWLTYGNSLGISNEAYIRISSGNFLSTLLTTAKGNLSTEVALVWMKTGLLLGAAGAVWATRDRNRFVLLFWWMTLAVFYVITGRTTGESWAIYYHIVSVPCACLLMAAGAYWCWEVLRDRMPSAAVVLPAGLCLINVALECREVKHQIHPKKWEQHYAAAQKFDDLLPEDAGLLIASGDGQLDQEGLRRACNAPYFFYWLDCKGFTLFDENQNLSTLEELRMRGARYYIAERVNLERAPGFEEHLRGTHRVLAETDKAILFELQALVVQSSSFVGHQP